MRNVAVLCLATLASVAYAQDQPAGEGLSAEQAIEIAADRKQPLAARKKALAALGVDRDLGTLSVPVVRPLLVMLNEESGALGGDVINALTRLGEPYAAEIADGLTWKRWEVRRDVAKALGSMKGEAHAAMPKLIVALKDADWPVRESATLALGEVMGAEILKEEPKLDAMPKLLATLNDKEWRVRTAGATALGNLNTELTGVVGGLERMLTDKEWKVREAAVKSLGNLKAKSALPELTKLIGPPAETVREVSEAAKDAIRKIDYEQAEKLKLN